MANFIIELNDGSPPTYWSDSPVQHPLGHWGDKKSAKIFAQAQDAQSYIDTHLQPQREVCKVVPL